MIQLINLLNQFFYILNKNYLIHLVQYFHFLFVNIFLIYLILMVLIQYSNFDNYLNHYINNLNICLNYHKNAVFQSLMFLKSFQLIEM